MQKITWPFAMALFISFSIAFAAEQRAKKTQSDTHKKTQQNTIITSFCSLLTLQGLTLQLEAFVDRKWKELSQTNPGFFHNPLSGASQDWAIKKLSKRTAMLRLKDIVGKSMVGIGASTIFCGCLGFAQQVAGFIGKSSK